ncbi:hypothetical protein [Massilia sp. PWRC2]|uniref:hypothetical protein n=1 Tax=Massilia sp. PWRC2 TaxID=2804626 RepID=UPI003CF377D1
MGGGAIVWMFDSLVGFHLTVPARRPMAGMAANRAANAAAGTGENTGKSWWQRRQSAWRIRRSAGGARRNVDLHRAFSLWTWGLLCVLAFSAFSLNLYRKCLIRCSRAG